MKNFIKEFLRKRKEKESQRKVSNYGDVSIQCIYHDHFIKIMKNIVEITNRVNGLNNGEDVFSKESSVKTVVKGETLTLNSSNNIFKESVLCEIAELNRQFEEKESQYINDIDDPNILDFSTIIIKVEIQLNAIESVSNIFNLFKYLNTYLDMYVSTDEELATIIISGSCRWYRVFKQMLIDEKLLNNNIIAMKFIECIDSIIPEYGTRNGNMYFTGFDDTVKYIEPYNKTKTNVQILSHNSNISKIKDVTKVLHKEMNNIRYIYIVIDNPSNSIINEFDICNIRFRIPGTDRYVLKLDYFTADIFLGTLERLQLEDNVNNNIRNNIISTIKEIILQEGYEESYESEDDAYANVDEIID